MPTPIVPQNGQARKDDTARRLERIRRIWAAWGELDPAMRDLARAELNKEVVAINASREVCNG